MREYVNDHKSYCERCNPSVTGQEIDITQSREGQELLTVDIVEPSKDKAKFNSSSHNAKRVAKKLDLARASKTLVDEEIHDELSCQ